MAKKRKLEDKIVHSGDTEESKSIDILEDNDTSDIDLIGKVIAIILIIINIAWLVVISPAIYNTLFPKSY